MTRASMQITREAGAASDQTYASDVRDIQALHTRAIYADPKRLFEASGSAGKVAGMAIRLDSFAAEDSTQTFYVGTNDPADFTALRRNVLAGNTALPIATEYLHGEAFDLAERYGRDMLDPSWTTLYESKSKRATKKFLVGVEPAGSR